MKKQLIVFVIIFLLITVGLSGCNNQNNEVSITEINEHANRYLNQTVTITAKYQVGIISDSTNDYLQIDISNTTNKPTMVKDSIYKFTGIIKEYQINLVTYIYLEVLKIEAV